MARSSSHSTVMEEYPSLLWVAIPSILLISAYFTRRWYLARKLRVHGIGKGAPGFQTNVRQIRVTPDIAARLRRGEQVSPEEIARASSAAEQADQNGDAVNGDQAKGKTNVEDSQPVNQWLPDAITKPKKRSKGKRA